MVYTSLTTEIVRFRCTVEDRGARRMKKCSLEKTAFLSLVVVVGAGLASCGSKQAVTQSPVPPMAGKPAQQSVPPVENEVSQTLETARSEELYARLVEDLEDYEETLELLGAGEDVGEDILQSVAARIRGGSRECFEIEGCDTGRFLEAQESLRRSPSTIPHWSDESGTVP